MVKILKFKKDALTIQKQMSHDSCAAVVASDWLAFFSSMARTKITPRKGDKGKTNKVKTRAEVHVEPEPPALAEPPAPDMEAPPTLIEMERRRAEAGEVTRVVTDLLGREELVRRKL